MIFLLIIGMSLVTLIPRLIPVFILEKLELKPWVNRWLQAIPYAALGALIFPGILSVDPDRPYFGLIGGFVAVLLAWTGINIVLVVIGAITTVFLLTIFIPM